MQPLKIGEIYKETWENKVTYYLVVNASEVKKNYYGDEYQICDIFPFHHRLLIKNCYIFLNLELYKQIPTSKLFKD